MIDSNRPDDYNHQGQQDDFFDADLDIAGSIPKPSAVTETYKNQGQQDDFFDADLSVAGNTLKPDADNNEIDDDVVQDQNDFFEQDLTTGRKLQD